MGTHPSRAAVATPPARQPLRVMACAPVSDCAYGMLTSAHGSWQTEAAHLAPSLPRALSSRVALVHAGNRATALTADTSSPRVDQHAPVVVDAPGGTSFAAAHHRLHDSNHPGPAPTGSGPRNRPHACARSASAERLLSCAGWRGSRHSFGDRAQIRDDAVLAGASKQTLSGAVAISSGFTSDTSRAVRRRLHREGRGRRGRTLLGDGS